MKKATLIKLGLSFAGILALVTYGSSSSNSSSEIEDGRAKITWLNILYHASPPTDAIVNLIEGKTDTELTFN